jgi:hypothetical protein
MPKLKGETAAAYAIRRAANNMAQEAAKVCVDVDGAPTIE